MSSTLGACSRSGRPAQASLAWGNEGLRDGSFLRPRAVGFRDEEVYVIDTTGRVQVFSAEGVFRRAWSMPESKIGTPTGIEFVGPDRVLIPDTHYSRVVEYSPEGNEQRTWGDYGNGPQSFIYPTGIAEGPDGRYYVSEYGDGAERIHVFDADRAFHHQWGEFGEEPGQFNRAMAIDADAEGFLYVADTGNYRVQVFDLDGAFVRAIGAPGSGEGQLKYPYDVAVAHDGTLLVADYGRHAILRYESNGALIAVVGTPGRGLGEFNSPRGVAASPDGRVFVADTNNHRIQRLALEDIA